MTRNEVLKLAEKEKVMVTKNGKESFIYTYPVCPSEKGLKDFCENNSCDTCWELSLKNKLRELEEENND